MKIFICFSEIATVHCSPSLLIHLSLLSLSLHHFHSSIHPSLTPVLLAPPISPLALGVSDSLMLISSENSGVLN